VDGKWSALRPSHFASGEESCYPLRMRLSGPQNRSLCFGEDKSLIHARNWTLALLVRSVDKYTEIVSDASCMLALQVVSWLRWLVTGLSLQWPRIALRPVSVGFMVGRLVMAQVFIPVFLCFSPSVSFYLCFVSSSVTDYILILAVESIILINALKESLFHCQFQT
jgi:hypothetical protein